MNYSFLGRQSDNPPAFKGNGFGISGGLEYYEHNSFYSSVEIDWLNSSLNYADDEINLNIYSIFNEFGYLYDDRLRFYVGLGISRLNFSGNWRSSFDYGIGIDIITSSNWSVGVKIKNYNIDDSFFYYVNGPTYEKLTSLAGHLRYDF